MESPEQETPENVSTDAEETPPNVKKSGDSEITMSTIESMVTPEQVLSASVARRRRNIAKKRSSSAHKRDPTPGRDNVNISSSTDEDIRTKSRTPERPRRKVHRTGSDTSYRRKSEDSVVRRNGDGCVRPTEDGEDRKDKEATPVRRSKESTPINISKETTPVPLGSSRKGSLEMKETNDITSKKTLEVQAEEIDKQTETAENKIELMEKDTETKVQEKEVRNTLAEAELKDGQVDMIKEKKKVKTPTPELKQRKMLVNGTSAEKPQPPELNPPEPKKRLKPKADPSKVRHSSLTRNGSIPRQMDNAKSLIKDGVSAITSITQEDVKALLRRAKKTITPSKKKELARRSQSNPPQFTEEELIQRFKEAKLLNDDGEEVDLEQRRLNRYSSASSDGEKPTEKTTKKPPSGLKPPEKSKMALNETSTADKKPEAQQFVQRRKHQRRNISSEKVIQLIDPRTSKILATRSQSQMQFKFFDFLKVLRYLPIKDIRAEYKAFKVDMKSEGNKIRIMRNKCLSELVALMILCGLGAIMFKTVEGAFENFYKCGVKRVKRDFIDSLWVKSHSMREEDWKYLARSKLRTFEEELHNAHEAGIHTYSGQRSWSFLNGIVYCLTIVTTIGYGHMAPTTTTGRALTIVYAIIGIPLFLIILTDFGKLFTRIIKYLWSFVRRVYYTGSCRRLRKQTHADDMAQFMYEVATFRRPSMFSAPNETQETKQTDETEPNTTTPTTPAPSNFEIDDEFNLPISLAIFILLLYIFLGALIYLYWEEWDFFASFYFVFISMSTIGFGDFVPQRPICMLVSIVYLVFGLALMSMCINVVQAKLSDTFKHASAKIGATIGLTVADEDGSITTIPPAGIEVPEIHKPNSENKKESGGDGAIIDKS